MRVSGGGNSCLLYRVIHKNYIMNCKTCELYVFYLDVLHLYDDAVVEVRVVAIPVNLLNISVRSCRITCYMYVR